MCKYVMRNLCILSIFLAALSLSSCTVPLELKLFNNTEHEILVLLHGKEIHIGPGKSEIISSIENSIFSIVTDRGGGNYEIPSIQSSHWFWRGWGPFSKRVFYAQLEEGGNIWLTDPNDNYPVSTFGEQPNGFPIEPST